jgi:prenyltransferase beta subunit
VGGMQGRPNKAEDTCYSYWIGGTLRLLGRDELLDVEKLRAYVLRCQSTQMGGFGKVVGAFPDLLHSFYSLSWLSLSNEHYGKDDDESLPIHQLNCTLGIRQEHVELFEGPAIP